MTNGLDDSQFQSYIDEIKSISNADYGAFDALRIQEYANAIDGLNNKQAALLLSTQGLSTAQIQQTLAAKGLNTELQYQAMAEAGLLKSKQSLSNFELQNVLITATGNKQRAEEIMQIMGLSVAIEGEEAQTVELTAKKLQLATATGLLTTAEAEQIAMTTGVTLAQKTQAATVMPQWIASMKAMTVATLNQVKATITWLKTTIALMATNPVGWCVLAVGAIASITATIIGFNKIIEQNRKKIIEAGNTARDEIKENAIHI